MKLFKKLNILLCILIAKVNICYADAFNYEEYDLFKGLFTQYENDPKGLILKLAMYGYNIFYLLSLVYFGYKILSTYTAYSTRAVHAIQQNQMLHEIFEPIKGLIYFMIGLTVIRILIGLFPDLVSVGVTI